MTSHMGDVNASHPWRRSQLLLCGLAGAAILFLVMRV